MKLSLENYTRAVGFVHETARDIDKALFDYKMAGGTATAVLDALAAYQNADGGCGHGLEPDFRLVASSPMATSVGLQYCTAVDASAEESFVQRAIAYLVNTYQESGGFWYATGSDVNDAPHAFWWHVDELQPPTEEQWPNPSAELVGYLHRYAPLVPPELLAHATARAEENLASSEIISGDSIQKYNLLCWERALPYLPPALQTAVGAKIRHTLQRWQPDKPEKFGEIGVTSFAPTPRSIMGESYPNVVNTLLAAEIERQSAEGGWWPAWHWGQYEEEWPKAKREWAGKITVETLITLRNFNMIAGRT